jgi:hypothetical protein
MYCLGKEFKTQPKEGGRHNEMVKTHYNQKNEIFLALLPNMVFFAPKNMTTLIKLQ